MWKGSACTSKIHPQYNEVCLKLQMMCAGCASTQVPIVPAFWLKKKEKTVSFLTGILEILDLAQLAKLLKKYCYKSYKLQFFLFLCLARTLTCPVSSSETIPYCSFPLPAQLQAAWPTPHISIASSSHNSWRVLPSSALSEKAGSIILCVYSPQTGISCYTYWVKFTPVYCPAPITHFQPEKVKQLFLYITYLFIMTKSRAVWSISLM